MSGLGSCLCKVAKLFCTPLCTCKVTGSQVCTNRGDVEVKEDGLIAAERDLVSLVPVRRRTNPIGGRTRGRGFLDAEGSLLNPNRLVVIRIRRSGELSNLSSSSGTYNARISPFFHFRSLTTSIRSLYRSSWAFREPPFASAANQIND